MSTRSQIILKKSDQFIVVYKHHDGYLTGSMEPCAELTKLDFDRLAKQNDLIQPKLDAAGLALGGCRFEFESFNDLPLHGDLEYLYILDFDVKNIDAFCMSWDEDYSQNGTDRGVVATCARELSATSDDYLEREAKELLNGLVAIYGAGWTFNGNAEPEPIPQNESLPENAKYILKQPNSKVSHIYSGMIGGMMIEVCSDENLALTFNSLSEAKQEKEQYAAYLSDFEIVSA